MTDAALEEHDDEIDELVEKWNIPRWEAQRLWENQHYE